MSTRIIKAFRSSDESEFEFDWWRCTQQAVAGRELTINAPDELSYQFIHGIYPYDLCALLAHAQQKIWQNVVYAFTDVDPFLTHFESECYEASELDTGLDRVMIAHSISAVKSILRRAMRCLTKCHNVHGNMTLDHVLQTGCETFVYLSPKWNHGFTCVEWDESSIFMSLEGWDIARNNMTYYDPPCPPYPMKLKKEHQAIMLAQYVLALISKKLVPTAREFATDRINEILGVIS